MTIGPVQLLVLGFDKPDFKGEIIEEFERLRENDTVRVIDALVVYKDAEGEVAVLKGSQLSKDEAQEFGAVVGGLLGLGAAGEEGMEAARSRARRPRRRRRCVRRGGGMGRPGGAPDDAAAALILLEHRWAIGLRDAVARAGGFPIAGHFISPLDLVRSGSSPPRRPRRSPPTRSGNGDIRSDRRRNAHDASTKSRDGRHDARPEGCPRRNSHRRKPPRRPLHRRPPRLRSRTTWRRSSSSPR